MDLKGRHFLKLLDYTPEEIGGLLELAAKLKAMKKQGRLHDGLRGKNVALIFEKTSTRTRSSFEVAAHDLGMGTTYLDAVGSQIGTKESIRDTRFLVSCSLQTDRNLQSARSTVLQKAAARWRRWRLQYAAFSPAGSAPPVALRWQT